MTLPTIGELCGGFWDGAYASPILDAYVAAAALHGQSTVGRGALGRLRGLSLLGSAKTTTAAGNGRPVVAFATGETDPVWLTPQPDAPSLRVRGIDFGSAAGELQFDRDPTADAATSYLIWSGGTSYVATDVLTGAEAVLPSSAMAPAGSVAALANAVATACDSPATGAQERVEEIWRGEDLVWRIVTNLAVYRLAATDTPSVSVGDTLPPGTPLGGAWSLRKLGPQLPNIPHLTTPAAFHQGITTGGITWYNETVALVVDSIDGRTRVRWPIGAESQGDADAFWAESHARGTAAGARSLAQALDLRTSPPVDSDPGPESLPKTINPLAFVCRELLAGAAYALVVAPAAFGALATTTAQRTAALRAAAGAYATVFEFTDAIPALTQRTPS